MRIAMTSMLMLVAFAASGCKTSGMLAKREAEKCCPTDIRKTVPWCAGEDALFHCPCKPSCEFYGYKPTCWAAWPASGSAWRDAYCGDRHHEAVIMDLTTQNPELITLPEIKPIPAAPIPPAPPADSGEDAADEAEQGNAATMEEPTLDIKIDEPKAVENPPKEDLPKPTFGPIPLPDIDAE